MPGREPPKPIRNQIAYVIHKDQEMTHAHIYNHIHRIYIIYNYIYVIICTFLAFPLLLSSFLSDIPAVGSPSKKDPDARDTTGRSSEGFQLSKV